MSVDAFRMYVIYDDTRDAPRTVVVRGWEIDREGNQKPDGGAIAWPYHGDPDLREQALAEARAHCGRLGKVRLERMEGDDPVIVETWI